VLYLFPCSIFCITAFNLNNNNHNHNHNHNDVHRVLLDRRKAIGQSVLGFGGGLLGLSDKTNAASTVDGTYTAYKIHSDASEKLDPCLEQISGELLRSKLTSGKSHSGGAVWLGEHHNSARDHQLQADIIRSYVTQQKRTSRSVAIGLEQVQVQFQPILDEYVNGQISEEDMLQGVQWNSRWTWPFEVYKPIFSLAREFKIPLIALNVNSEDLAMVERGGMPGLSKDLLKQYITDLPGFSKFISTTSFKEYVQYVITPSYQLHKEMGLLKRTMSGAELEEEMSFQKFFSGRMLWDESMATNALRWCTNNPGGIIFGLVGADHVKFDNGVPKRFDRISSSSLESVSVVLNPTVIDSRPSGSIKLMADASSRSFQTPDRLTLQLRYVKDGSSSEREGGGVLPFADYILVSKEEIVA